jgi:glycosyltransferase involved in cell wall biosynthesis
MLRVAQISFFVDPEGREPQHLLNAWESLVDVAEAAASATTRVSVIQASSHAARILRGDVDYRFVRPDPVTRSIVHAREFIELLQSLEPDVLHVHGLGFPADVLALHRLLPHTPILLQDHANRPPRIWKRKLWRHAFSVVAGVAFCATAQAQPFVADRLIGADTRIFAIPESTSRFMPGDREDARRVTALEGEPCVLWVGHLNDNKDPLTVLEGVSRAVGELPGLQLWCCYGVAPLLGEVQARIQRDSRLRGRVHLLGRVNHQSIEQLMRAADIFVLGSHREGSGYALIEALACGLSPVVTDIPSFRALTNDVVGRLWSCGDPMQLSTTLVAAAAESSPESRARVRAHFDRELSLAAVGRKFAAAYERIAVSASEPVPA